VVDGISGRVERSYGDSWTTEKRQLLKEAHHIAVDDDGFVFVADNGNDRVVLLSPSLQLVRYIPTRRRPAHLRFEPNSRRLFVGHQSNVVTVIQLIFGGWMH